MKIAEEELGKIQKLPGDTPEQQAALEMAQEAFEEAKKAKQDTDAMLETAKKQEEEAD